MSEIAEMRAQLAEINRKLDATLEAIRTEEKSTKPLTVEAMAKALDMCPSWVYKQVVARKIKKLPGFKCVRIPRSELVRLTTLKS